MQVTDIQALSLPVNVPKIDLKDVAAGVIKKAVKNASDSPGHLVDSVVGLVGSLLNGLNNQLSHSINGENY